MTTRAEIRQLLAQGRYALSVGRVKEVVPLIKAQPALARHLVELLFEEDLGISQRAADVLERVSHKPSPALYRVLARSKDALVGLLPEAQPKKVRWNLALTLGRLPLTVAEARRAAEVLQSWLDDPSSIVKTAALQCLADLTSRDRSLLPMVLDLLRIHSRSGTAAMRARCRLLLQRLEKSRETR
ncbi:MAG: hypothetical protein ABR987_15495 [Terracidiphilus sp.]|jgi:hypothetical protein